MNGRGRLSAWFIGKSMDLDTKVHTQETFPEEEIVGEIFVSSRDITTFPFWSDSKEQDSINTDQSFLEDETSKV